MSQNKYLVSVAALMSGAVALFSTSGHAASLGPAEDIGACRALAIPAERLRCYDSILVPEQMTLAKEADAPKAIPQPAPILAAAPAPVISTAPGAEAEPPKAPQTAADIEAIQRYAKMGPLDLAALHETVEVLERDKAGVAKKISTRITDVETQRGTRVIFTTADGSKWQQVEAIKVRLPRNFPKNGLTTEIQRASFGSFFLKFEGNSKAVRVKLLK